MAKAVAATLVDHELPIVEYPGVILHDSPALLRKKVRDHLTVPIVAALQAI